MIMNARIVEKCLLDFVIHISGVSRTPKHNNVNLIRTRGFA